MKRQILKGDTGNTQRNDEVTCIKRNDEGIKFTYMTLQEAI